MADFLGFSTPGLENTAKAGRRYMFAPRRDRLETEITIGGMYIGAMLAGRTVLANGLRRRMPAQAKRS
uniref:hypothetical protein n=1 Tax=Sphingomonas bacterium TaxID=1895847 RepID=UPI002605B6B2|nr:hypothetical protein [Sphingomonas bacterium]